MGKNSYLLSVDIGTESGRAALLTLDGQIVANCSQEYPIYHPYAEWSEQDPEDWWIATLKNIKNIISNVDNPDILAICICGQMHVPIPINKEGNLLSNRVILWSDKRSSKICEKIKKFYDEFDFFKITGNTVVPTWTGFKIKWIKDNNQELYKKSYKFVSCKDYLNFRLTKMISTDFSEASGTFLFDIKTKNWSQEILSLLDIDVNKLPEITKAYSIIGKVTKEAANLTGLKTGIPVVAGGGDMMCLLLGAGITEFGQACEITGTGSDISVFVKNIIKDERLMHIHHVVPKEGFISFGILDSGGGSLKWFKDTFCSKESLESKKSGIPVYEYLDKKAEKIEEGSEKLIFLPYLLGERTLGTSSSRGVFFGFTPRHEIAHCVRAIMEGVTYDLKQSLEIIESKKIKINDIRAIGGGAQSNLWCEIKTNIYGKYVRTLKNFEGGIVGGAILAGLSAGIFNDIKDAAKKFIHFDRTYKPDKNKILYYKNLYRLYKELHGAMQPYFLKLAKSKTYSKTAKI
ncbi:MAG: FGGY family carbohydrate kinase [Actinobacteria bacterium]|nr:FGGY family carbohydrate kinase [Actinomycetota bacterium]